MEEHFNETEMEISNKEEQKLYNKARKRVQFKVHLMIFFLTNLILWLIFWFGSKLFKEEARSFVLQFVLFVSLAWGVVIYAHYLIVYRWGKTLVEKEFDNLKKEHKRKKKALENKPIS